MPKKVLLTGFAIYFSLLAFLFFFQRQLQYLPMGRTAQIPDGFKAEILTASDGVKILSWYHPAKKGEKIFLYFHGNAGNIGDRGYKFSTFADGGFGVLAISYRGYLGSEGKPTEVGLIEDGKAALTFLLAQGYQTSDVILFGESLGSGIAVQLAAKNNFAALVLESPFASVVSVAQSKYWFAPVKWLVKDRFDSEKFAPEIISPVLVFHGTNDQIVSISEGQKLFEKITSPKKFIEVQGAGHLEFPEEFLLLETEKFLNDFNARD